MKPTINIIGAGKVGRVLGHLFFKHDVFTSLDVLNRSLTSGLAACEFIGAGRAVNSFSELRRADVVMLAVSDDQIRTCADQLRQVGLIDLTTIVFHCSGALGSNELGISEGAASLHPVRSFADPDFVAEHFADTMCSLEGSANAVLLLENALKKIGADVVKLDAKGKTLYHAAAVFGSNYLVTLMDTALTTFQAAGISSDIAQRMVEPLARETLNNVFNLGTQCALTGPIARGDKQTVERHRDALMCWDKATAELYMSLARATEKMKARK